MKLILNDGYPFPYPKDLTEEQQDELSQASGNHQITIEGVKYFEWRFTITVEFNTYEDMEAAMYQTGWKRWEGYKYVLEAPTSQPDGREFPAIIANGLAYCHFIVEG